MFNETRLLDSVAYGSQFGQEFSTRITTLKSGHERRQALWSRPLGRYSVLFQALKPDDHTKVRSAHMACMGALIAFRFKDWADFQAAGEPLGVATGALQTIQLTKAYQFGPMTYSRIISKPVSPSVIVYADDVPIAAAVDYTSGEVTVMATAGAALTWSGDFDVPVRFEDDRLDVEPIAQLEGGFALTMDVDLVEVRL